MESSRKKIIENVLFTNTSMPIFLLGSGSEKAVSHYLAHDTVFEQSVLIYLEDFSSYREPKYNMLACLKPIFETKKVYFFIESLFDIESITDVMGKLQGVFFWEGSKDHAAFLKFAEEKQISTVNVFTIPKDKNYRTFIMAHEKEIARNKKKSIVPIKFKILNDSDTK